MPVPINKDRYFMKGEALSICDEEEVERARAFFNRESIDYCLRLK